MTTTGITRGLFVNCYEAKGDAKITRAPVRAQGTSLFTEKWRYCFRFPQISRKVRKHLHF